MHNILAAASQPQPHLLSPLISPLNEEQGMSGTAEQEMENIGNRIGNGILRGFVYSTHVPVAFHFPDVLQKDCVYGGRRIPTPV